VKRNTIESRENTPASAAKKPKAGALPLVKPIEVQFSSPYAAASDTDHKAYHGHRVKMAPKDYRLVTQPARVSELDTIFINHSKVIDIDHQTHGKTVTSETVTNHRYVALTECRLWLPNGYHDQRMLQAEASATFLLKSIANGRPGTYLKEIRTFELLLGEIQSLTKRLAPCGTPYAEDTL
jgi:hypothetical protein